jgi:putrescine aminotransferase
MLFGCDRDGVIPDVMTLAKGLSGGVMPVGAYIARPSVWNAAYAKHPVMHTSTFGGNELACAAALASMNALIEEDLVENARERGAQLLAGAQRLAQAYPGVVKEARGLGLLVGIELTSEGYGGWIIPEMVKRGVTAAWTLNMQRVIRLEPPLVVTREEVDVALAALEAGLSTAQENLGAL